MTRLQSQTVAAAILRLLFLFLLALLGIGCAFAVIFSAVVFYRSSHGASYRDVESLVEPIADLKEIWSDNGEVSALQSVLAKKNQELQAAIANLESTDRQVVSSKLQTISANFSYLEETLDHKRDKAAGVVGDLEAKVAALKNKVGPPAAPEKVIEVLFRETGGIFIALLWPLVLAGIFFYLLRSRHAPEQLRSLLGGFKSLKLGVAEIVLNDSESTKARTEDRFAALRDQAKLQYDLWVQRTSIRQKLEYVLNELEAHFNKGGKRLQNYRCTLHVPDLIFADTIYQLLDYLPSGGGRGRIFSVRFGIIGKVWRLFRAEIQGTVPLKVEELVQDWGMTQEEAKSAALGRPSFLCVPLKDNKENHVGMFYMDSSAQTAFDLSGTHEDLYRVITEACEKKGVIEALTRMKDELSGRAPLIRIYER